MREIVFTSQYKRDFKLALRRDLPMTKLNEESDYWQRTNRYLLLTKTMHSKANFAVFANAIFNPIGC